MGVESRLEVWGAGYGPKALKTIGETCDGFILQLADPDIAELDDQGRARRRRGGRPRSRRRSRSASPPPRTSSDDIAHMRDQCRWFGGMVGNHVADIVTRYGESSDVPQALTDYIKGREGYDYNQHGQAGNTHTEFVPDEIVDRFCILGPAERAPAAAGRAARARRRPVRRVPPARRQGLDPAGVRRAHHPQAQRARAGEVVSAGPGSPHVTRRAVRRTLLFCPRAVPRRLPLGVLQGDRSGEGRRVARHPARQDQRPRHAAHVGHGEAAQRAGEPRRRAGDLAVGRWATRGTRSSSPRSASRSARCSASPRRS